MREMLFRWLVQCTMYDVPRFAVFPKSNVLIFMS